MAKKKPKKLPTPLLNIPDAAWDEQFDCEGALDENRLLVTVVINGCLVHLEAWAVADDEDGVQQALSMDVDFDKLQAAVGTEGRFTTVRIRDKDFVLVASPYCQ